MDIQPALAVHFRFNGQRIHGTICSAKTALGKGKEPDL
jgi:hypothetical protein